MNKAKLIKKLEQAIEPTLKAKGYGDNPEELRESSSEYVYLTAEELIATIGMRRCNYVALSTDLGGYDEECFKDGETTGVYAMSNNIHVRLGKKVAKKMIADVYSPKLFRVLVGGYHKMNTLYKYSDEHKFSVSI
tara:strand:- start:1854 stop:2258 length:405 start_codon:yes stop_codon:yes gene_type:complete